MNNSKKIIIGVVIVAVFLIFFWFLDNKNATEYREYLSGVYYKEADDQREADSWGVIRNSDDLGYDDLKLDFVNNDYLYYVLYIDSCTEEITGITKYSLIDGVLKFSFGVKRECGLCALMEVIYFIPIEKGASVTEVYVSYDVISSEKCDPDVTYKPILYLYPTDDIDVSVRIEKSNLLLTTYPKYNSGWNVHVLKDGSIYDRDNKYYYALYWDELSINKISFDTGFYVTKDKAISFLEEKLSIIGLTDRERNEFIMYWLPVLERNEKSLVYFELTDERNISNRLIIEPKPDSLLRINMHVKKVDREVDIKEQMLDGFVREGFVCVEWGGTIH